MLQEQYNPQNYNRYAYVLNNPATYVNSSGYFIKTVANWFKRAGGNIAKGAKRIGGFISKTAKKVGKVLHKHARLIASVAAQAVISAVLPGVGVYLGAFVGGLIGSGGDFKAGLIGMVSAGLFTGVGEVFQVAQFSSALAREGPRCFTRHDRRSCSRSWRRGF